MGVQKQCSLKAVNKDFTAWENHNEGTTTHHNRFTAIFSGTAWVSQCQKTSALYGAREA